MDLRLCTACSTPFKLKPSLKKTIEHVYPSWTQESRYVYHSPNNYYIEEDVHDEHGSTGTWKRTKIITAKEYNQMKQKIQNQINTNEPMRGKIVYVNP